MVHRVQCVAAVSDFYPNTSYQALLSCFNIGKSSDIWSKRNILEPEKYSTATIWLTAYIWVLLLSARWCASNTLYCILFVLSRNKHMPMPMPSKCTVNLSSVCALSTAYETWERGDSIAYHRNMHAICHTISSSPEWKKKRRDSPLCPYYIINRANCRKLK